MELIHLLALKESESKVEFMASRNNFKYAGSDNCCVLGYTRFISSRIDKNLNVVKLVIL